MATMQHGRRGEAEHIAIALMPDKRLWINGIEEEGYDHYIRFDNDHEIAAVAETLLGLLSVDMVKAILSKRIVTERPGIITSKLPATGTAPQRDSPHVIAAKLNPIIHYPPQP